MLHSSPPRFHSDCLFKQHQRLVPLTNNPLVRLLFASRIRSQKQTWPEAVTRPASFTAWTARLEPWCLYNRCFEDEVEPVEGGLQIEIVPESVAEDECVRATGFGGWEEGAEAGEFFGRDGEADHLLDWEECGF